MFARELLPLHKHYYCQVVSKCTTSNQPVCTQQPTIVTVTVCEKLPCPCQALAI